MLDGVPAPGGSVTIPRFGVYLLGSSLGMYVYSRWVSPAVPDSAENWNLFGIIPGQWVWMSAFGLLGAAAASMLMTKVQGKR